MESLVGRPYATIGQWPLEHEIGSETVPFQAAQEPRELIDKLAHAGPVLIMVDDLQWADVESVETVAWIVHRAVGDRLLVAAATRPLRAPAHPSWRRLLLDDGIVRVRLDGLGPAEARQLLDEVSPGIDPALATRLCEHTAGNPLYLRALLAEHSADELRVLADLPAPDDLAVTLARRLATLPVGSADLIRAVAVLGSGWVPLALAAGVGEVIDPGDATRQGVEIGLLDLRRADNTTQVRITNSVTGSAVQAGLATDRLRELQYARASVPEQYWGSATFKAVNKRISAIWAGVVLGIGVSRLGYGLLAVSSPGGVAPVLSLALSWLIPIGLVVAGLSYTKRLPGRGIGTPVETHEPGR